MKAALQVTPGDGDSGDGDGDGDGDGSSDGRSRSRIATFKHKSVSFLSFLFPGFLSLVLVLLLRWVSDAGNNKIGSSGDPMSGWYIHVRMDLLVTCTARQT